MANAELPAAKSEASAADAEDLGAHPQVSTPKRACAFAKSNMRQKRARRTRKEVPTAGEFFDELQITCEDDVLQKAIKKLLSGMPVEDYKLLTQQAFELAPLLDVYDLCSGSAIQEHLSSILITVAYMFVVVFTMIP